MKRILFFLVLAFVVFGTNAQNAHLKFMGIPLDGKISAFNKELKKKGFMLDEFAGKKIEGTYIYNGIFAGERAQVFVSYDDKTQIVYQAVVIIRRYSKESVTRAYEDMRDMLEEKYSLDEGIRLLEEMRIEYGEKMRKEGMAPFEWKHTTEEDGYEATTFLIPNLESRDLQGDIKVFVKESFSKLSYSTDYNLYIRYSDWQNDNSQRNNRIDDL